MEAEAEEQGGGPGPRHLLLEVGRQHRQRRGGDGGAGREEAELRDRVLSRGGREVEVGGEEGGGGGGGGRWGTAAAAAVWRRGSGGGRRSRSGGGGRRGREPERGNARGSPLDFFLPVPFLVLLLLFSLLFRLRSRSSWSSWSSSSSRGIPHRKHPRRSELGTGRRLVPEAPKRVKGMVEQPEPLALHAPRHSLGGRDLHGPQGEGERVAFDADDSQVSRIEPRRGAVFLGQKPLEEEVGAAEDLAADLGEGEDLREQQRRRRSRVGRRRRSRSGSRGADGGPEEVDRREQRAAPAAVEVEEEGLAGDCPGGGAVGELEERDLGLWGQEGVEDGFWERGGREREREIGGREREIRKRK